MAAPKESRPNISWRIVLLILVISAILMGIAAAQKSFWEDEAFTANAVQGSFSEVMKVAQNDVHPPLYLVSLMLWARVFTTDELPLRSFSILFSLAALALTYLTSQELFGRRVAVVSLVLMAFSPLFILYGQNARYYSMAAALSMLAVYSMLRFLGTGRWYFLVMYGIAGIALLYLLFAAVAVLAACNLWAFWEWLLQKRPTMQRFRLLPWFLTQGAVLLLYLPGLKLILSAAGKYASQPPPLSGLFGDVLKRVGFLGFVFSVGETLSPLNPAAWLGLLLVIVLMAAALFRWRRSENILLPVLFLIVIGSVNVLISLIPLVAQTWQNLPYRMFYAYPFFIILLAVGINDWKPAFGMILGGLLLGVFSLGLFNYYGDREFIRPIYTVPWRAIFTHIQAEKEPGAVVICDYSDYACFYYSRRYIHLDYVPASWENLSQLGPPEVWWIESNTGINLSTDALEKTVLKDILQHYQIASTEHYAPQNPSIRWIKATLLKREDYEYRVNIYRFRRN